MAGGGVKVRGVDADILMELQYEFPLTPTPYEDVAGRMDLDLGDLIARLKSLAREGILKRVGYYYNYRSQGHTAALVAFDSGDNYPRIAEILRRDPLVTHNFLRDHELYNVWIVAKRPTREELLSYVDEVCRKSGCRRWIALFSRKTYKLSVKYDLYKGISRSGSYSRVVNNPPTPEELGIDPRIPKLARVLPLRPRPYSHIAERTGLSEEEVVSTVKELLDKGVLGDPGAALEGREAGFKENAMIVMEPAGDAESLCSCAADLRYSTHVVLRDPYPPGTWRHICYFMVHAVSREIIKEAIDEAWSRCKPKDLVPIYSIKDLKPGIIR